MKSDSQYHSIKKLLIEKRYLQYWLRQVDKQLRELELLKPGMSSFIRPEIKNLPFDMVDCAGSTNAESVELAALPTQEKNTP